MYDDLPMYSSDRSGAFPKIMGAILAVVIAAGWCGRGCLVDGNVATHALHTSGYSDPRVVDRSDWWASFNGCGEGDAVSFDCRAKSPKGESVRLIVCCGAFVKACTVRVP